MKDFSGAWVYEIVNNVNNVNKVNNIRKKCLKNFCSTEKWMMLEIGNKNVFKIVAMSNNLVFICSF